VFIQSFEVGNLKEMRGLTTARIVQLLASSGHRLTLWPWPQAQLRRSITRRTA
jgi:glycerophosphoryl diester phosphodiesterase